MNNVSKMIYAYTDEQGNILFSKIRVEPGLDGRSKSFYYEREENGQIVQNIEHCRKVLYRLPDVINGIFKDQTIFIVEGEKDADNLASQGLVATTAPLTTNWHEEFTQALRYANVVILYDNDKTGLKRKDLIAQSLSGKTKSLKVVDLPDIEYSESHGKDISDWLAMGNTIEQLLELVNKAPQYIVPIQDEHCKVVSLHEFLELDIPKREMILDPFLFEKSLVLIYSKRGVGKTHVALGIAYAIAKGGSFLRWRAQTPRKVLYIDGEMTASELKKRLLSIDSIENIRNVNAEFLQIFTPDLQEHPMPNLSTDEGKEIIEKYIQGCDVIIIDNISSLFRGLVENDAESWSPVQEWSLSLKRRGKAVVFIHHAGKSGAQRGTSKKEDAMDIVINLKRPEDYKPSEGAKFEVHFEKIRNFAGDDANPFHAHLREEDGIFKWELSSDPEETIMQKVAELRRLSYTIQGVADKTGLTKSQVETLLIKAKNKGLV